MFLFISVLVTAAVCYLIAKRSREDAQQRVASGMNRSPLYWIASGLTLALMGVTLYIAHLRHSDPSHIPAGWWLLIAGMTITILLIRRALKWRFPYR
jgi:cytochrome bd-type quinol oxidase subunit 2